MIKISLFTLTITCLLFTLSCKNNAGDDKNVVTKRIQYDVTIHNTDPDMDWWVQNLEGSNREKLIKDIMQQVTEGKVKAYDYLSCKQYSIEEVKKIMKRVDTISVERSTPPYDLVDTVLVTEIRLSDISRLRFLEEWRMNEKTLEFSKKVGGICPMIERHSDSGDLRGYKALFWVFFDDKYPAELQQK